MGNTNTYNQTKPNESSLSNSPTTHTLLQPAATSLDRWNCELHNLTQPNTAQCCTKSSGFTNKDTKIPLLLLDPPPPDHPQKQIMGANLSPLSPPRFACSQVPEIIAVNLQRGIFTNEYVSVCVCLFELSEVCAYIPVAWSCETGKSFPWSDANPPPPHVTEQFFAVPTSE